jgi:hypothetical protein
MDLKPGLVRQGTVRKDAHEKSRAHEQKPEKTPEGHPNGCGTTNQQSLHYVLPGVA